MTTWLAAVVFLAGLLYGLAWKPREQRVSEDWIRDQIRRRGRH